MSAVAASCLKLQSRLEGQRTSSVETSWRDCYDFTDPLRGDGLGGSVKTADSAQGDQSRLNDATASDAASVLAANLVSGMTPSNVLWFGLSVGDENEEERLWLADAAKLLWENIHMANFDAEAYECNLDMATAGQFYMFVDEDRENGGFTFSQWHVADCWAASTRADGRIDKIHHKYQLTAEQAANEFGEDKLPEKIRKCLADDKPDEPFEFLHVIQPRKTYAVGAKLAKNMPFASLHIAVQEKVVVREGGYHEFPVMSPRWLRVPRTPYGVGPMYRALPDVRQINYLKACEADAADVAISGMWIAKDDGVLNPRNVRIGPKRIVVASDTENMKPLQTGSNFDLSEIMYERLAASIRKIMMADNFPPAEGAPRTAYEWQVRVELIRKILGPIYGRLQTEYLKPLVERCFGIAYRAGIFRPAPESLRGRNFSVAYVGPMARAQKAEEVAAIESTFMSAAEFAKASGDPSLLDELNIHEGLRLIAEGKGAPTAVLRKPEEVDALRQKREADRQKSLAAEGAIAAQQVGMEEAAKKTAIG